MRLDRVVGLLAFLLAGVTIVVGGLRGTEVEPGAAPPTTLGPADDVEVTARFLDFYERADTVTYGMAGAFVRVRNGQRAIESSWREVQRPPDHLIAGLGSVRGTYQGRTLECSPIQNKHVCSSVKVEDPALAAAQALDIVRKWTVPQAGPYALRPGEPRIVAGEQTECFVLQLRPGWTMGSFGERSEYCYSTDAIPLYVATDRVGVTDVRAARVVARTVTDEDFELLLR